MVGHDLAATEIDIFTPVRNKKKKITGRALRNWELCNTCVQEILDKLPDAKATDDY